MLEITKAKIHCALKKQLFYALIDSSTAITANQPLEERKEKKKDSITISLAGDRAFLNGASAPRASQGSERGLALTLGKPLFRLVSNIPMGEETCLLQTLLLKKTKETDFRPPKEDVMT